MVFYLIILGLDEDFKRTYSAAKEAAGRVRGELIMDIERLKTEWQNQKLKGYLFDTPLDVINKDVRKKAQMPNCKYQLAIFTGIAVAVIIAAVGAMAIYKEHSLSARAASLILIAINFFELFWLLQWRLKEYNKNYELPAKRFLIVERDTIEKKLRQIRWQLPWSGITSLLGLAFGAQSLFFDFPTGERYLDRLIGFTVPLLMYHFSELWKIKSELPIVLATIEREFKQFEDPGIGRTSCRVGHESSDTNAP
jgi:hypothetical protein